MNIFSKYSSSYIESILKSTNSTNYWNDAKRAADTSNAFFTTNTFLSNFVDFSNSELKKRLCSQDFLQDFKNYIQSIANIESIQKHFFSCTPFSYQDNLIDESTTIYNNNIVSINQTPNKVIAQMNEARILHYFSLKESCTKKYTTPLLMVYAPINRYHIMDLSPHRSIVNKFVSAGFDVFLLDWGDEQSEDKSNLSDYVHYIDQAVELINNVTKNEKINLYGYSWGGTMSLIYCAIHNNKIKNLILQSTNFDFDKDDTVIAEWMRNFPVEKFNDEFKEIFGHFIDLAFIMRNPLVRYVDNMKYALDMKEDQPFQFIQNLGKISAWITNTPDISSRFFSQVGIDLYQKNLLVKNQLSILERGITSERGKITPVNLKNITIPILNVVGSTDDLVSPNSSIPINEAVSSKDKKTIEFPSGHIELCISYEAHQNLWPQVVDWLESKSEIK